MNITSEQHLRSIIGAPQSITEKKKIDHLSDDAMAFLARSPFLIMTTVSEDLQLDASPKAMPLGSSEHRIPKPSSFRTGAVTNSLMVISTC